MALTKSKWVSLNDATPEALEAELARRKAEAEADEQARKQAARDADKRRKELTVTGRAELAALRDRLTAATKDAEQATDRPSPMARSTARAALLSGGAGGAPFRDLLGLDSEAAPMDGAAATLFNVMQAAGRVVVASEQVGAAELADEADALECEAFDALYRRVAVVAGIRVPS